jgi:ZIP family zinc transporter
VSPELLTIVAVAGSAALASPAGGLIALWHRPTSLFMSLSLGFASGVLLATIGLEMLPRSLELGGLWAAMLGFAAGFLAVYAFDLFVHRGRLAGEKAEQRAEVDRFHRRWRPRGGEVTVLAGGTSAEELIEGLSIGVGAAIEPSLGVLMALAIAIDNVSEALSVGEVVRSENAEHGRALALRVLGWTGLIGAALLGSAVAGWLFLRGLPGWALATLLAAGAGGMFYLTVTDLVPQGEERHYQQSAALATGAGFMTILILSELL